MKNLQRFLQCESQIENELLDYNEIIPNKTVETNEYRNSPSFFRGIANDQSENKFDYANGGTSEKIIELVARTICAIQQYVGDAENSIPKYVLERFLEEADETDDTKVGGVA